MYRCVCACVHVRIECVFYWSRDHVLSLQVTKEVLILRRFPDEKLSSRLWNDCIVELSSNAKRETVSVKYHDSHGEFKHHFHSKQVRERGKEGGEGGGMEEGVYCVTCEDMLCM